MRTLITLIIGIIIGAAALFYGLQNGMVTMNMLDKAMPGEAPKSKPHAEADEAAAPQAAAAPAAIRTQAAPAAAPQAQQAAPAQRSASNESNAPSASEAEDDIFADD